MVAASLVLKVCVLSGLISLIRITSTFASVSSTRFDLQSTDFGNNATQGHPARNDSSKAVDVAKFTSESSKNNSTSVQIQRAIVNPKNGQTNRKINVKSLISPQFTLDKILVFIETSNNFLNGKTNFTRLDKFMRSYDRLYASDGMSAFNNFLNMCVSFWTVVDAVANIFRAYETRYLNAKDENKPPEPNPLEDLQASLDDANNNIAIVSNLFQTIGRMGELDDDVSTEKDRDDNEAKSPLILKRTLMQGTLQEEEDNDDESGSNRDDDEDEAGENHEKNTKDSLRSSGQEINIQQNYQSQLPVEIPFGHFVDHNSAKNGQILRSPTKRHGHLNPVGDSQHIQRFSVKSDSDNRINRQPAPKTTTVHPQNLELHQAIVGQTVHSLIRNKRSSLGHYEFGIDKFVYILAKMNNVLNSNTNNRQLNRFTRAFNDLFASDGLSAFNTFYTLLASFWTIVDAVANVFRFNEARIRDQIQQNQAENQPDPLADLQTELDDTNANLEEVADLVTTLDGAAARLETAAGDDFDRSGVKKKKKKKKAGGRRRKPSLRATTPKPPQPTRHFYNPVTHGSYPITQDNSFSKVKTNQHHNIQPATVDSWQPIDRNWSPIHPQPSVETNRHFYYPVSYGSSNFNSRLPSMTTPSNLSPISHRSNIVGLHQLNPQPSLIPANRYAMNYGSNPAVSRWSNLQSPSEINRHSYSNDDYRTYSSRMGLHPSTVSGQPYRKSSVIVQPKRK